MHSVVRQNGSLIAERSEHKAGNGFAAAVAVESRDPETKLPPPPPPPAGFRPLGERSGGSVNAGNATQRLALPAMPAPPPRPSAAGRTQFTPVVTAAPAAVTSVASPPRRERDISSASWSSSSSASAAGAAVSSLAAPPAPERGCPSAASRTVVAAREAAQPSPESYRFGPAPLPKPPPPRANDPPPSPPRAAAGSHVHAQLPPGRSSSPPAAADDGRSTLAAAAEDEVNPWREAAAAGAPADAAPYYLNAAIVAARLDRPGGGVRNFESRDSINTDDCPTDASSMRRSMYSVDTVRCGTPYEGHLSVNADTPASDAPLCGPASSPTASTACAADGSGERQQQRWRMPRASGGCEGAALINGKWTDKDGATSRHQPHPSRLSGSAPSEYRIGSCWHCLINVPCPSLLTWLSLCMATLGWSVSGYMTASQIKKVLQIGGIQYGWLGSPGIDEICIITIGVVTVCIGIFFLVVATFSSESMSRYFFNTRSKNKTGRCVNVGVLVLCYMAVAVWSCICAALMVPMTILGILNWTRRCIQLEALGFEQGEHKSSCEIDAHADLTKEALVTLTICLAFAFVVQLSMAAFLVNVSSNIRHLKETRYETYNSASSGPTQLQAELRDTAM